jgi:hypothetical protein
MDGLPTMGICPLIVRKYIDFYDFFIIDYMYIFAPFPLSPLEIKQNVISTKVPRIHFYYNYKHA